MRQKIGSVTGCSINKTVAGATINRKGDKIVTWDVHNNLYLWNASPNYFISKLDNPDFNINIAMFSLSDHLMVLGTNPICSAIYTGPHYCIEAKLNSPFKPNAVVGYNNNKPISIPFNVSNKIPATALLLDRYKRISIVTGIDSKPETIFNVSIDNFRYHSIYSSNRYKAGFKFQLEVKSRKLKLLQFTKRLIKEFTLTDHSERVTSACMDIACNNIIYTLEREKYIKILPFKFSNFRDYVQQLSLPRSRIAVSKLNDTVIDDKKSVDV